MSDDRQLEVRSYRAVFSLERRIYRVDTLRLNPAGVPLRGIAYALTLLALSLLAGALPGSAELVAPIPWYLRDLAFPALLGGLLAMLRIDGRAFHVAAAALLRHRAGPGELVGLRPCRSQRALWRPSAIAFIADGSGSVPRELRYQGPGVALVCYPHDRVEWPRRRCYGRRRTDLSVHPLGGARDDHAATALELASGTVLAVSCRPWSGSGRPRG